MVYLAPKSHFFSHDEALIYFRCLASVVAVSVAISLMLQNKYFDGKTYDIKRIKKEAQRRAITYLEEEEFTKYVSIPALYPLPSHVR